MPPEASPPPAAHVGAVVPAFAPAASLLAAVTGLAGEVAHVVVVDDGTPAPDEDVLAACEAAGAVVVRHGVNRGIAAALNTGVRTLRDVAGSQLTHVLTLDQDSAVPPGYVASLLATERSARAAGTDVGMVGPERAGRVRSAAGRRTGEVVRSREPIQSGLLVPSAVLDALGPFDEDLFIDGVDTDFYLRATTRGLVAVVAPGTRLEHELGQVHVLGVPDAPMRAGFGHAAPFRYYYIARNRVHLVRRFGRAAPAWALSAVVRDVRHLALAALLVPARREILRNTLAGLRDGRRGVRGPRPTADGDVVPLGDVLVEHGRTETLDEHP